jgi:DNA-binding transcriptional ArsR family regulator
MVEYSAEHLDETFHALAHPIRRAVIAQLAERDASITEIASWFDISLNGVSKHIKVLEHAGLLTRTVAGRTHSIALQPARLDEASEWITYYRRFWERRLDALARLLESHQDGS